MVIQGMVRHCFTHIMSVCLRIFHRFFSTHPPAMPSQAPPGREPRRQPCHWPTRASPRPRAVPCDATAAMSKFLEELVRNLRSGKKYVILEATIFWMSMLRYDMFWIILKYHIYIYNEIYLYYHTLNNINKILKRENPHRFLITAAPSCLSTPQKAATERAQPPAGQHGHHRRQCEGAS